jgi:TolB-like protein
MSVRQLSAIMFADLAGYTAMMQENEFDAIGIRDRWKIILEKEVVANHGQVIQYYGDGALSIFKSTLSASNSALAIQIASLEQNIPLRIGIHVGDVVVEDSGVYGDGVNIASRIESFSVPGSIMVSDKVYDDLKNHQNFNSRLMGEFELKNVKKPVEVYALTNTGLKVPLRTELKGKIKERIKSIAVLPFSNRSNDPENEYFSDGITEEIITALAKSEGLRVISRTSSFSYKGKQVDIREIGKQLEVQSVLDGSVRKSGNKIRISAQLSSTFDGFEVWSESYDRELEDIFDIQDEIASKIALQLMETLVKKKAKPREINIEAYNHYLQGLFYYYKWTPGNAQKAIESFQKAIDLEPEYDQALAGIGLAYGLMGTTGYMDSITGYERALEASGAAIKINDQNESAFVNLSYVHIFYKWDFEKGKMYAEKALEVNKKAVEANLAMALYYIAAGKFDVVFTYLNAAKNIDPLSTVTNRTIGDSYYFMGEYEKAIEIYEWILDREPDFMAAKEFKARCRLMLGSYDEAIGIFKSTDGDVTHAIQPATQLGFAYAKKGDTEMALTCLKQLEQSAQANPAAQLSLDFATLYTGLNMTEQAFDHLDVCLENRLGPIIFLNVSPVWESLRGHSRFEAMVKKIGINEDSKE